MGTRPMDGAGDHGASLTTSQARRTGGPNRPTGTTGVQQAQDQRIDRYEPDGAPPDTVRGARNGGAGERAKSRATLTRRAMDHKATGQRMAGRDHPAGNHGQP